MYSDISNSIIEEGKYINNFKEGLYKRSLYNGIEIGNYINGVKQGKSERYNFCGELIEICIYRNDYLINITKLNNVKYDIPN